MYRAATTSARIGLCLLAGSLGGAAQEQPEAPGIEIVAVAPGIHMLQGRGGNIGVMSGPDETFMIDDEYAPLSGAVVAAIATFTDKPVAFVFNTHWHEDHTGGNESFGKSGALIVAHDNVRARLGTEQFLTFFDARSPASPPVALPIVTFDQTVTFRINGEEIHAFHVPNAHTDGNAIVHFRKADVIHTGDIFFNGMYPFIDYDSGGSIEGTIAAADRVLALAGLKTKIIPGHGPLADRQALQSYRAMLEFARARMRAAMEDGQDLGHIIALKPTADYDATWGQGFLPADKWVEMLYRGMLTHAPPHL